MTLALRRKMPRLGFGTMAVGGQYADVSEDEAHATIVAAYRQGIRLFDTAPQYGCGLAEERLGRAITSLPRDEILIASKVGKRIAPLGSGGQRQRDIVFPAGHDAEMVFDYSFDGTLRLIEQSLGRLGVSYLDIALIHDVTQHFHGDAVEARYDEALGGCVKALHRLRDERVVRAIGTGLKDVDIAMRFIEEADIDAVLVPGRLTLIDQSAISNGLTALCDKHGIAYIAASPFDSGILATGAVAGTTYGYKPADDAMLARVREIERVCRAHGVALQAAALQYALLSPAVVSVLAGMKTVEQVEANAAWLASPVPAALWAALAAETGLVLPDHDLS